MPEEKAIIHFRDREMDIERARILRESISFQAKELEEDKEIRPRKYKAELLLKIIAEDQRRIAMKEKKELPLDPISEALQAKEIYEQYLKNAGILIEHGRELFRETVFAKDGEPINEDDLKELWSAILELSKFSESADAVFLEHLKNAEALGEVLAEAIAKKGHPINKNLLRAQILFHDFGRFVTYVRVLNDEFSVRLLKDIGIRKDVADFVSGESYFPHIEDEALISLEDLKQQEYEVEKLSLHEMIVLLADAGGKGYLPYLFSEKFDAQGKCEEPWVLVHPVEQHLRWLAQAEKTSPLFPFEEPHHGKGMVDVFQKIIDRLKNEFGVDFDKILEEVNKERKKKW